MTKAGKNEKARAKIKRLGQQVEIDAKRCHLPFTIKGDCEGCGVRVSVSLLDQYLSNPTTGSTQDFYLYCHACHTETPVRIKFDVKLTLVDDKEEEEDAEEKEEENDE